MTAIVKLSKEEVRVCTMLAVERWLTKFGSTDKPNYLKGIEEGKLEHELNANIRANVAEWAAAKHYNISWNVPWYPNELHTQRASIPDAGTNVEVRTVRTQQGIPVWAKDNSKTIVGTKVLDTKHFSKVEVFGYYLAENAYKDEWKDDYIGGWRIPIGEFIYAQQK